MKQMKLSLSTRSYVFAQNAVKIISWGNRQHRLHSPMGESGSQTRRGPSPAATESDPPAARESEVVGKRYVKVFIHECMHAAGMTLWAILFAGLTICVGCGRSQPNLNAPSNDSTDGKVPSSSTAKVSTTSSHDRMRLKLDSIRRRTNDEHPYVGSSEADQLRQLMKNHSMGVPISLRWDTTFRLAQLDLQLGNEEESIEQYLWCQDNLDRVASSDTPADHRRREVQLMFELGVAYMRLGETQNCCLRNHPESCILPIKGKGIHSNKEGSQKAIKCFMRVLEMTSLDNETERDLHLSAQWLLNIAWMTLGKHPQSVATDYLIPLESFGASDSLVRFVNVSKQLKLDTFSMSGGVIVDDFDNDEYLDLIVSPWSPASQLKIFHNNQDGTFDDWTERSGIHGFCGGLNLVQADYDNDGDVDLLVLRGAWLGSEGRHPNSLLRNNGDSTFTDVTLDVGMNEHFPTQTASWADYDNDGDLDVFIGNESDETLQAPCQLYRQDSDGIFRDVAAAAGVTNNRYAKGVSWGDFNRDCFPDLYVSNHSAPNRLYENNRDGTFTDIAVIAGVDKPLTSFPTWFWDFDNDGSLDLFVSAYTATTADLAAFHLGLATSSERSCLYRGDGKGGFQDVTTACGLQRPDASMGANFGDLDNDGYLDFYLGTGYPRYESLMPNVMYRNLQGRRFVDVTVSGGFGHLQKGHAIAFADFDHDGDQDIFEQMGGAYPGDRFNDAFYENPGSGNHWITLRLTGSQSNRSAIGARIDITITEDGKQRHVFRHVNSGGSFGASPLRQTIGLGTATKIDRLDVFWPTTGKTQSFDDVPMDGYFLIIEDQDKIVPVEVKKIKLGGLTSTD